MSIIGPIMRLIHILLLLLLLLSRAAADGADPAGYDDLSLVAPYSSEDMIILCDLSTTNIYTYIYIMYLNNAVVMISFRVCGSRTFLSAPHDIIILYRV